MIEEEFEDGSLEVETNEHECYGIGVDRDNQRIAVEFDNGPIDGVTYVTFETLQKAGFVLPGES